MDIMGSSKKHKKHKKEKYEGEKPPALKLILKVGSSSTPEHSDSPGPLIQTSSYTITPDDESLQSTSSFHKKSKKKKKKRERDHEKHERKKKHHHKEKKRHNHDDSSQDNISLIEDSSTDVPIQMKESLAKHTSSSLSPDSAVNREARLCVQVLRQKQNIRSPLQRVLDYLQQQLEKKDVKQVFAWPVTDQIAPGYSQTIAQPMDFSTMRQKIDDNCYRNLNSYISDLRLMCNNAMIYNRPDTIYYKAAKRLLHAGLKFMSSDKLRQLAVTFPTIKQVPAEQLGFQIGSRSSIDDHDNNTLDILDEVDTKDNSRDSSPKRRKYSNFMLENKFEAIPDDLSPEEVLVIAQRTAKAASEKLSSKVTKSNMGYLSQNPDGTTSLTIYVNGEENKHNVEERIVSLGQLIGKINHTGQLQGGPREDRRNVSKTVKPLNYGAFGSYAPSYDSTFANLTKEETDLICETYGEENATMYAESIINFAKDCDYTLTMVDNLLDVLTGGEHRKTKNIIEDHKKFREEEEQVRELMEVKNHSNTALISPKIDLSSIKVEFDQLRSLSEYGIDISFLNSLEPPKSNIASQEKLEHATLLEKLQQVQNDRLSSAPTQHLSQIIPSSDTELHLADKIESFTELAKQVSPETIIPVPAIRKPMNIVPEPTLVSTATNTVLPMNNSVEAVVTLEEDSSGEEETCVGVGVDFESELREFLESDTALSGFPLHDDKTIEEMLSES